MSEFSREIHVSVGNAGDWESAKRPSTSGTRALVSIANAYNVSLDWPLLGKDIPATPTFASSQQPACTEEAPQTGTDEVYDHQQALEPAMIYQGVFANSEGSRYLLFKPDKCRS